MAAKFFEDANGDKSHSRLIAFIVIMTALVFAEQILIFGIIGKVSILLLAGAMGTNFITIAGPAMYFLFNQKKTEEKAQLDSTNTNTSSSDQSTI